MLLKIPLMKSYIQNKFVYENVVFEIQFYVKFVIIYIN